MKRRWMLLIVLLTALFAMPADVEADSDAYTEGISFFFAELEHHNIQIEATKTVDGDWRQTTVMISSTGGYYFSETTVLYEDPDGLDVSDDLGWGGLEGQITAYDRRGRRYHVLEFHVWQYATESGYLYNEGMGYFRRNARVQGYVLMDGQMWWDFSMPLIYPTSVTRAYNFSDQWPGY
jgi:hypothetical protein